MIKWLEISADFVCNNRCVGCFSVTGDGPRMSTGEAFATLRRGRAAGAEWLWLGGGEPTLRKDLFAIAAEARRLGYRRIKLQTNGMLLSYPEFVERAVDAGINEVNFAIKGSTPLIHDRLTQTPGCFELMVKGMAEWRARGLPMDGDILLYRSNIRDLAEMVRVHTGHGVERYNLWLFSAVDQKDDVLASEVPRIGEVIPFIEEAAALGLGRRSDFISSLHTPPCTVPPALSLVDWYAADLDLLVANPGGYSFRLEESPIEGGLYFERCRGCALRSRCNGVRKDYVAIFGDEEFQPVAGDAPMPRRLPILRDVAGLAASAGDQH
jgi:MoaA/NifB/PqqE/SkfB family radical SAM enzyme